MIQGKLLIYRHLVLLIAYRYDAGLSVVLLWLELGHVVCLVVPGAIRDSQMTVLLAFSSFCLVQS